jgi:zinc protease
MLDRSQAPAFRKIEKIDLPQAESATLANGIRLHWLRAGVQPVIRMECLFRAGTWYEPQNGISYFTVKMMNEGTARMSSREINEYFDQYGAFIEFNHGTDRANVTVYFVSKHLDKLLPVLKEILLESVFPEAELDNLKNITIQNLKVNTEKTSYLAQTRFKELLFGDDHPYGRNLYEAAIRNIHTDNLKQYYDQRIRARISDIILSGDVSDEILALIRNAFEAIDSNTTALPEPTIAEPLARERIALIEKPDSLQSSIRVGKRMFTRRHPDYFRMLVLNEVLGGYFGSRLMKNIREDKGFTYGISSNIIIMRHQGFLTIGTDVKKEFTGQTLEEIYKEIQVLQSQPVPENELQTVKNYMIGSFAGSLSTPFDLADRFKTIYFDGLTYEFYDQYLQSVLSVSSGELLELANTHLALDSFTEVVAGGK